MATEAQDNNRGRLIERTLGVWQPRTGKTLTAEDAREIARNVTGFFEILRQWEVAESAGADTPGSRATALQPHRSGPGIPFSSEGKPT